MNAVPEPAELRGVTDTFQDPLASPFALHETVLEVVRQESFLVVRPSTAAAEYVTDFTRVSDTDTAPFDTDTFAPVGLAGTDGVMVAPTGVVAGTDVAGVV